MGAYTWAGVLAVAALALVLWRGGPQDPRSEVELSADAPWTSAVLDDGHTLRTVGRGERVEAPPGLYRVTLFGEGDEPARRELKVEGALTTLR